MARISGGTDAQNDLRTGGTCFLCFGGRHFLVKVFECDQKTLRVSTPGKDYPTAGMGVELECHDEKGYTLYRTVVLEGPDKKNTIVLQRPERVLRNRHRDCCRVPTDLTVQVKDQVHLPKYDGALQNISSSGALILTEAPFDFTTTVELTVSLPGQPVHTFLGQIVHIAEQPGNRHSAERFFGIRFVGIDPLALNSISQYIRGRLQELHPTP